MLRPPRIWRRVTGRERRLWSGDGYSLIEYRAPDDPADHATLVDRLATEVVDALGVEHVVAERINRRLLVRHDALWSTTEELAATVERVEEELGHGGLGFPIDRGDHPADIEPLLRESVQVLSDLAGVMLTVWGRTARRRPMRIETDLSWLGTLAANVPQLRRTLDHQLGPRTTELLLGLTNSVLRGLAQGLTGHVVDGAVRAARLRHQLEARAAWQRRATDLLARPVGAPVVRRPRRGEPVVGPVERYADTALPVSLGGFGASLLATDDLQRSSAALLDGIPKAARHGRDAFAAELGRVLAERDALVLDRDPFDLLDRASVVVVDERVLDARALPGHEALAAALSDSDLATLVVRRRRHHQRDARSVRPEEVDGAIAELQGEGHVVVAIGRAGFEAFARADVTVGVPLPDGPVPWDVHVLCTGDLADAALVVRAAEAAARNSREAVQLTLAGAVIGAATALGGMESTTPGRVLAVADLASLLAIGNGLRRAGDLRTLDAGVSPDETPWHALDTDEVLQRLASSPAGLPRATADERTEVPEEPAGPLRRYLELAGEELSNPLTPVLALGAALSLATGALADAGLVGGVVALNAAIGGAQRLRTEHAMDDLRARGNATVAVVRGGEVVDIPASQLVRGDIIRLGPGEAVPADARILTAASLEIDESNLTGESLPVAKDTAAVPTDTPVAERRSMLYQGTSVAVGEATAVVVATGAGTEARRAMLTAVADEPDDVGVAARLETLTRLTIPTAMMSGVGVAAAGLLRGVPAREVVDAAVGLAIAAVPEGLPLLSTVAQVAAARRLSRRGMLVRNPATIEALGRVDIVCADKTGTLTQGRLALTDVSDGIEQVRAEEANGAHTRVLLAARRATPIDHDRDRLPHPTDQAVAEGTRSVGVRREDGGMFTVVADLPFAPGRSYHAVVADVEETRLLSVKGAPEEVMERSTRWTLPSGEERELDDASLAMLLEEGERLATQGLRVLAVADRPATDLDTVTDDDVQGLTFRGFIGLRDPVRPVSADSVRQLRDAGIRTVMITGDHATTGRSIADELDLGDGIVLTGPDIDELDDDELAERLEKTTVFARVTPSHKVRVVQAFQRAGHVVAMTGDGANDAPAIRLADVGIAVGSRATAAAREAADLVIVEDRLEVIVDAIAEGRGLWGSVRDAVAVLVGGNLGEIGFTFLGSLLGGHPPLNARQLLGVNLLTDVVPAMALAVKRPASEDISLLLREGPESSLGEQLDRALVWRGLGTAVGATGAYGVARCTGTAARARTVGLVSLVGAQLGQTLVTGGRDPRVVAAAVGSAGAMFAMIQLPGLSRLIGSRPLGPVGWLVGAGGAAAGTVVGTVGPWAEQRLGDHDFASNWVAWISEQAGQLSATADPRAELRTPAEVLQRAGLTLPAPGLRPAG